MFWTELFSSFYLLSWHWLANWPKLYRFVKFTHRIKPSYLSTFSSTAFAGFVRKGLKSLISQVNQLYLSIHMFYKTFRSVLRNTSFLQNQVFLKSPIQLITHSWVKHTWISMKLKAIWNTASFNGFTVREIVPSCSVWNIDVLSHSLWQGLFYSQH